MRGGAEDALWRCTDCVERLDPALDFIVDAAADLELIHQGDGFFEGPVWVDEGRGHLLFSDIAGNVINRWDPESGVSIAHSEILTGATDSVGRRIDLADRTAHLIGPNGLARDLDGRLVYCGYGPREVVRIEADNRRTVLASRFNGLRFNTPNDLVFKSNGTLYFTDSSADLQRSDADPDKGVPTTGLYRLKGETLEQLSARFTTPNGLAFSPDERLLYVNDTVRKLIVCFSVEEDDRLTDERLFVDMNADERPGRPDGMKVDRAGNVYCTGPGGLWVTSAQGRHLGTIRTPEGLTNVAFGGARRDWLFMTSPSHLYRLQLEGRAGS